MYMFGAGLLLMASMASAAGLHQRQCLASQNLKICLYQDARLMGEQNGGLGRGGEVDEWKPPLAGAELRVYDQQGRQLSRLRVGRLSQIRRSGLIDNGKPVLLLDEDHSVGFGSYSGIETRPFTVGERGLRFALLQGKNPAPLLLISALKSAWMETRDGFLLVSCAPDLPVKGDWDGQSFRISYRRLTLRHGQWLLSERSERGFWEAEGDFPAERLFPK